MSPPWLKRWWSLARNAPAKIIAIPNEPRGVEIGLISAGKELPFFASVGREERWIMSRHPTDKSPFKMSTVEREAFDRWLTNNAVLSFLVAAGLVVIFAYGQLRLDTSAKTARTTLVAKVAHPPALLK